jgi:hypothetical protein
VRETLARSGLDPGRIGGVVMGNDDAGGRYKLSLSYVGKRFARKQQMQWMPRGAHLLLQIRALDGTLRPCSSAGIRALPNNMVNTDRAAAARAPHGSW